MGKKEILLSLFISFVITLAFFYKVILGQVPFPGDLLMAEAKPWSTYSYAGYLPGTVPTKVQYPDVIRQLYPWRILAIDQMKKGQPPLWNPYNFSGTPLLANFQSAPFYPLNLLFWILPAIDAWTVLVMIQPTLALWFTYLFLRKLKLSPIGSWFGAVSYAYSAFATVLVEYNTIGHVTLWLPLIFLSIESIRKKLSAFWMGILLLALTSAALAGHPQIYAYLVFATIVYGAFRGVPIPVIVVSILSVGIAGVQYIPGIELIRNAARSNHEATELINKILIQPWQLLALPFPNIFGNPATRSYWPSDTFASKVTSIGLIPLFFLPALFRIKKNKIIKFLLISIAILLVFITRNPISTFLAYFDIPLWSTSNPTLMVFLLNFAMAIGLAYGIDAWTLESHSRARLIKRVSFVVVIFIVLISSLLIMQKLTPDPWPQRIHIALRAVIYASALAFALCVAFSVAVLKPKLMKFALIFLLVIHTVDLWWMFQRFNPFAPKSFVFPSSAIVDFLKNQNGYNRFWGYGTAAIGANISTQLRLYSPDGYDPLYPKWYGEYIGSSQNGNLEKAVRSDAIIVPGYGKEDLSSNLDRLKVLDFLSVRYILDRVENGSTAQTFPPDRFQMIYEQDGWKVFENLAAYPRTMLSAKGDTTIVSYSPNEVVIEANALGESTLILSDTYFPGWKAFIDGLETPIHIQNHAFREVLLPKGKHTIVFRYKPNSFKIGIYVSSFSMFISIITLIILSKRKYETT